MEFSKRLKDTLMWQGITQEELAKMLNVNRTSISQWISGRCYPKLELFYRICLVLRETPNYMLGFED